MAAPAAAVRPFAGGVPRGAATAPSDASSQRASYGKKRPRVGVAPARDSSLACLTKMTCHRNSVVTAAGEMSAQEHLHKRLASELDALRGLLKKAELISRRGACKGGAPTAGKKERFLASNQRAKPIEEDFYAPSVKKRKISTLVVVEHKQKLAEESKDNKVAEESKSEVVLEKEKEKEEEVYADISVGLSWSWIIETGSKPSSRSSFGDSDTKVVQQSTEAKTKVQDALRAAPKAVDMPSLLYRAKLRRQLLEMERAAQL